MAVECGAGSTCFSPAMLVLSKNTLECDKLLYRYTEVSQTLAVNLGTVILVSRRPSLLPSFDLASGREAHFRSSIQRLFLVEKLAFLSVCKALRGDEECPGAARTKHCSKSRVCKPHNDWPEQNERPSPDMLIYLRGIWPCGGMLESSSVCPTFRDSSRPLIMPSSRR